ARFRKDLFQKRAQRLRLNLTHSGVRFDLDDESQGIQFWLSLLPEVITSLSSGHTLVIDEINTSLHPLLAHRLVGLFRDSATNASGAQLLFTTHDAFLLGPLAGEPGMERDHVWFIEKCPDDGASQLYPLTDFHERDNERNLARRYLGGAYGAIPILDRFDLRGSHDAAD
ncbi:MAG: AAA family ATPase, partial [Pseudonocardiaceae bacterium]